MNTNQNKKMNRNKIKTHRFLTVLLALLLVFGSTAQTYAANTCGMEDVIAYVVLNKYKHTIPVNGEFYLFAITSNATLPTFKSSNSSVATVNTYGLVTGKKPGSAVITAKIKNAEARCRVTVSKSTISLSRTALSLENGESFLLSAKVSSGNEVKWKSSSSRIASVDEDGTITAKKCGTTTISASADGTIAKCKLTVKKPNVKINKSSATLTCDESLQLVVTCSNNSPIKWKSSRSSIASVDEDGYVYANKPGTVTITATVDGVCTRCRLTVLANPTMDSDS